MYFCYFYIVIISFSDREMIIGISFGSFGLCVLFASITVIVVGALLYWRKHRGGRRGQYDGKTLAIIFIPIIVTINFFVST